MSVSLNSVLEFLAHLYQSGKAYSTININRSMLSKTLPPFNGNPVGIHPLVKNLLDGCYNLNPPKPRYDCTWDPNAVINYLSALGENRSLAISVLTRKTVMLLALASLLRVSELASINLSSIIFSNSGVTFTLLKPRKAQHNWPLQSIVIPGLPDSACCPVEAIRVYVDRTATHRNDTNINSLFISFISPHGNVTANTISGWIRSALASSRIDTSLFKAHSTRGAAASKALASGMSVDRILKAGHWSSASTFGRFYQRDAIAPMTPAIFNSGAGGSRDQL